MRTITIPQLRIPRDQLCSLPLGWSYGPPPESGRRLLIHEEQLCIVATEVIPSEAFGGYMLGRLLGLALERHRAEQAKAWIQKHVQRRAKTLNLHATPAVGAAEQICSGEDL